MQENHFYSFRESAVLSLSTNDYPLQLRRRCRDSKCEHTICRRYDARTQQVRDSIPKAKHWARLSDPLSGVSLRFDDNSHFQYYRLDKFGQRRLLSNTKKSICGVLKSLSVIYRRGMYRVALDKWKDNSKYHVRFTCGKIRLHNTANVALLKTIFLTWKYDVTCKRHSKRCFDSGALLVHCIFFHHVKKKLLKYFKLWHRWSKDIHWLMRNIFDLWSLFAYKSKLTKYNVLKSTKILRGIFIEQTYRKRKSRVSFFFNFWRHKTMIYRQHIMKKSIFQSWCEYRKKVFGIYDRLQKKSLHSIQKACLIWWRVASQVEYMWTRYNRRLKLQVR